MARTPAVAQQSAKFAVKAQSSKNAKQSRASPPTEKGAAAGAAALAAAALVAQGANALTYNELQGLTYLQVKGTGLANTCPVIGGPATDLKIKGGNYKLNKFCMEPTSFSVKDESAFKGGEAAFVDTKLMTRLTYTLDAMEGNVSISGDNITLNETDGIDYAATTVQLPGGERVPFLFTVKQLAAKGTIAQFGGDFNVPSYRGSSFLDPKSRGASLGVEIAQALPAAQESEELQGENVKTTAVLKGSAVFNTAKYDASTGEIAGVFESIQPSDTDLGSKAPKDVKITGLWYGQLS